MPDRSIVRLVAEVPQVLFMLGLIYLRHAHGGLFELTRLINNHLYCCEQHKNVFVQVDAQQERVGRACYQVPHHYTYQNSIADSHKYDEDFLLMLVYCRKVTAYNIQVNIVIYIVVKVTNACERLLEPSGAVTGTSSFDPKQPLSGLPDRKEKKSQLLFWENS